MFKHKLIKYREGADKDRNELAKQLGVTYQMLFMLETGKREPSVNILKKFSEISGMTIDELLEDEGESHNAIVIQKVAKELQYNYADLAWDIGADKEEIKGIIEEGYEPSPEIVKEICRRYNIPASRFRSIEDKSYKRFVASDINRAYIEVAYKAKEKGITAKQLMLSLEIAERLKEEW